MKFLIIILLFFFNLNAIEYNIIFNSNFHFSGLGWKARYWHKKKIDYLTTNDINISAKKNELILPIKKKFITYIKSPIIQVNQRNLYTLKIRAKSLKKTKIQMGVFNPKYRYHTSYNLTNEFKEYTLKHKFPVGIDKIRVDIKLFGDDNNVTISNIELITNKISLNNDKFFFDTREKLALYEVGSSVEILYGIEMNKKFNVIWKLYNHNSELIKKGIIKNTQGSFILNNLKLGWYKLVYGLSNGKQKILTFSILPKLEDRAKINRETSYFGSHFEITDDGIKSAKLMGFTAIRLNSPLVTKWNAVEETKGKFEFNDKAIDKLIRNNFLIIGTLDRTALWASSGKNDPKTKSTNYFGAYSYVPNNFKDWKVYVKKVTDHYKDKIKYWQIWNEPDIQFLKAIKGKSNAQTYQQFEKATYNSLNKVKNNYKYLSGIAHLYKTIKGPGRQTNFIDEGIKLKLFKENNIMAFHYYFSKKAKDNTLLYDSKNFTKLEKFKKKLGTRYKYWITEFGFDCIKSSNNNLKPLFQDCMDAKMASKLAIKFNIEHIARGIEKIFFYNGFFDSTGHGDFWKSHDTLWDSKKPRMLVQAYGILTWMIDGKKFINYERTDGISKFIFSNKNQRVYVLWSDKGNKLYSLKNINSMKIFDLFGKKLNVKQKLKINSFPKYIVENLKVVK